MSKYAQSEPDLVATSVDSIPDNNEACFQVLADACHPSLAPLLANGFVHSTNSRTKTICREGLLRLQPLPAAAALRAVATKLEDPGFATRPTELLIELGTEHTAAYCLYLLRFVLDQQRPRLYVPLLKSVADYLSKVKIDDAKAPLVELLMKNQDHSLRRGLITAIWRLRAVEAIPVLESLEPIEGQKSLNKLAADTLNKLQNIKAPK